MNIHGRTSRGILRWVLTLWLAIANWPAHSQTGPVAWWKFDEGTGTSAADSSGNGYTGTLVNSPTWVTGHTGPGALSFNGGTSQVTAGGTGAVANLYTSGLTVSAWIKPTGAGGSSGGRIVDKDNNSAGWFFEMSSTTTVKFVSDQDTTGSTSRTSAASISLNTWQHVLVTWTGVAGGANAHIYINGVQADGATTDGTGPEVSDSSTPLTIGNRQVDSARGFAGTIDDVRIYNRILSASEIQALADATPPSAPSGLSATAASNSQVNLSWTASTDNVGVTGYLVERCQGTSCSNFSQIGTPTGTTYSDTGLTASTSYTYRVRATDAAGNLSGYSSTASATTQSSPDTTPPTAPTGLTATTNSSSQISLSWTASTDNVGVTGYQVQRCQGAGCSNFALAGSPTATAFSDTGLTASTSYSYRVLATDAAGNLSAYSSTASATTSAAASGPVGWWKFGEGTGTTTTDSSGNGDTATLVNSPTWTTGHIGPFALTFNGTTTELTASGAGALANLYLTGFTVSAWINPSGSGGSGLGRIVDRDNNNVGWFFAMNGTGQVKLTSDQETTGSTTRASSSSISLNTWQHVLATWTGQSGGANMHIYINGVLADGTTTDGTGPILSDAASPLTIGNRQVDAARGFAGAIDQVRIYNRVLAASEIQALANGTPPTTPTGLTGTAASSSQVNLSWTASSDNFGVTQYLLERCQGASCSNFAQVATPTSTTYNDTGLAASTSYSYRARATDAAGNLSSYSSVTSIQTTAPATMVTYNYDGPGRLKNAAFNDGTSITYNLDPAGNRTSVATVVDTTPPSVPTGLAATVMSAYQINLSWTASTDNPGGSGVAGYKIYRGGAQIATSPSYSFSDTTVKGSTTYSYTVAAYDGSGNTSAQSTSISLKTPDVTPPSVPTGLTASAPTSTLVNLSWSASTDDPGGSGVAGYTIYRGGVQLGTSTSTTYADSTVSGTMSYSYTVAARDVAGNISAQSAAVSVMTPDTIAPSVPTSLTASTATANQVNLSWSASTDTGGSGLAGYYIYRGGAQIGTSAATSATFTDSAVIGSTTYSYTVAAYDKAGNVSAQSAATSTTTPAWAPVAPQVSASTLQATVNTYFTISWTSSLGATSYQLYETNLNVTPNTTTQVYTGSALSQQRTKGQGSWQYWVNACNATGCSANSNSVTVTVCPTTGCP